MKVCVYLEFSNILKNSGIYRAYENSVKMLKLKGIDVKNISENYDIIHLHTIGLESFEIANRAKKRGKKVIISTHTTPEDLKNSFYITEFDYITSKYLKLYYNVADALIAPSNYCKKILLKHGINKKIYVLSNGIDYERFKFSESKRKKGRELLNLNEDEILVFSVGIFIKRKGVEDFYRIAKRFKNIKFIWFGRIIDNILYLKINKKLENLWIFGTIDENYLPYIYSAGDIFFFPSYEENQGIVTIEAAASKNSLLLRNLEVYREWLSNKKDCLLANDLKEFEEFLHILIEDEKLRRKLSKNATKSSKNHDLRYLADILIKIYEDVYNNSHVSK